MVMARGNVAGGTSATLWKATVRVSVVFLRKNKQQVLHLLGKTTVKGNVIFESGEGVIEQGPGAKIEGKITGATVHKR